MTMAADSQNQSTNTSQHLPETTKLNLPPPQIFDVLPALHELLARIERAPPPNPADPSTTDPTSSADEHDIGAYYQDQPPLEPKDLPTEVLAIKAKIRKALREVEKLPDMESSVEEQEDDIRELEERVQRQRAMVRRFGELAGEVKVGRGMG